MSQQLIIYSVSPFLLQQLQLEGVVALEIFEEADPSDPDFGFDLDEYAEDYEIELSDNLRQNASAISQQGMASAQQEILEIAGRFAEVIHLLLAGNVGADTLTGRKAPEFPVQEEIINGKPWLLANALVSQTQIRDAEDYVASYWNSYETQQISAALDNFNQDDLTERVESLGIGYLKISNSELMEAKEFISGELRSLYKTATEKGYGILISWSI